MTAATTPKALGGRARLFVLAAAVLVVLALTPAAAQAATNTFQGPGTGWNTAANWSQMSVPDATDDVVIPSGKGPVLSTAPDGVANSIALDGSLTVSGGRTLTVGAGTSAFSGTLLVDDGATLRLNGTTTWSAGDWQVEVTGSTVENGGTLNITGNVTAQSFSQTGQMRNLAGATLNRTTSAGTASFKMPFDNDGSISVQSGELALTQGTGPSQQSAGSYATTVAAATLAFNGDHVLSSMASISGPGTARFDGGSTALASGATYSPATTAISGGFVSPAGLSTTGRITSDGEGGGRAGAGTLNVGTGASNFNNITFRGGGTTTFAAGSTVAATGTLLVDDGATLRLNGTTTWSAGDWQVEVTGSTVENGGTLNITGNVTAQSFSQTGQMRNLAGATLNRTTSAGTASFKMPFDNAGNVNANTGTLRFSSSAPSFNQTAGTTQVASGATLGVNSGMTMSGGVLKGTGTVDGSVSNTGGTVAPGASPGILKVTGSYTQGSGGTLNVEVNGTTPGTQHDQLDVTGAASLDGTLDIDNVTGHDPPPGDTFKIVKSGSRTGTFATVTGEQLSGGKSYEVTRPTGSPSSLRARRPLPTSRSTTQP